MAQNRADFLLETSSSGVLGRLSGPLDANLRLIENRLGVHIHNRGLQFNVTGPEVAVGAAAALIRELAEMAETAPVSLEQVHTALQAAHIADLSIGGEAEPEAVLRLRRAVIRARGPRQVQYLQAITRHDPDRKSVV